jgi:hypothetical protein
MNESQWIRIAAVTYTGEYSVRVQWLTGRTFTVDLRETIFRSRGLQSLRDPAKFSCVFVGEDGFSLEWPGELDLGADNILEMAFEQNGRADAVEFIRWRWKHSLTLSAAAEALGLSRRQVAYYASGERVVPRHILLALKGWEVEKNNGTD